MISPVAEACVGSVRLDTQELHIDERVEHALTCGAVDAAQTLRLLHSEAQAWHFQVFGTDPFQQNLVRHLNSRRLTQ